MNRIYNGLLFISIVYSFYFASHFLKFDFVPSLIITIITTVSVGVVFYKNKTLEFINMAVYYTNVMTYFLPIWFSFSFLLFTIFGDYTSILDLLYKRFIALVFYAILFIIFYPLENEKRKIK